MPAITSPLTTIKEDFGFDRTRDKEPAVPRGKSSGYNQCLHLTFR